jgi:hypothetical protein
MSKTGAQALIEEGMEKGMELGVIKAKQEALIRILNIRFGLIPRGLTKKINSICKIDELNTLFDHAVKANELDDIETELKN